MSRFRPSLDWNRIILDLSTRGYTLRIIGAEIEVHHSTIAEWKNSPKPQPKYEQGKRLISLWCDVMGLTENDLPANLPA